MNLSDTTDLQLQHRSRPAGKSGFVKRAASWVAHPHRLLFGLALVLLLGSLLGKGRTELKVPVRELSGNFEIGTSRLIPATAVLVPEAFWSSWPARGGPQGSLTMLVWVLVIFSAGGAIIHQGSYTLQMVLLSCLAVVMWKLHPLAFGAVVLAQAAVFPRVWLSPPLSFAGMEVRSDAIVLCIVAVAAVLLMAFFGEPLRRTDLELPPAEPAPARG